MVKTFSTMLEIGTQAPDFELLEPASGKYICLSSYKTKPLLIVFSCNHCPYVIHLLDSFTQYANEAQRQGLSVVMINANDVAQYPADSPDHMVSLIQDYGFDFPYLYDQSQAVAMAYRAACTPDFFLFDHQHALVYRGQYDSSRPGNQIPVSGNDLKAASNALLTSKIPVSNQLPSMGCNIKWRQQNQPDYF